MIGYIARDKSNQLYIHPTLPVYDDENEWWWSNDDAFAVKDEWFEGAEDIKFEHGPIKVELNLKVI